MERLISRHRRMGLGQGLAWIVGGLATVGALAIAAVLAVFAAATVLVIAVMATALLTFAGAARRARRTVRASAPRQDQDFLEARNVGGHSWVAYGWDGQRR
jgi:hypothetical protein